MYPEKMTERLAILGVLHSQSLGVGTDTSITNIDMKNVKRLLAILDLGAIGASGTVDMKLRESKTSGGTYQDISGKAITQLTASDKIATIEVRQDELDAGYEFVQVSITIGTAASQVCVLTLGGDGAHKPENANNISAVAQQV